MATESNIQSDVELYFTERAAKEMDWDQVNTIHWVLFKNTMTSTVSMFESHYGDYGCLSINGLNDKLEPITFNIEYVELDIVPKISIVDIMLLNHQDEYKQRAICPN